VTFIRSRKSFFTLLAIVVAFALFAGVTFVQSQETKTAKSEACDPSCPMSGAKADAKPIGMPGSCSELHKQAVDAGKMTEAEFTAAEAKLTDAKGECVTMTPEQCQKMMAAHGKQCDAKDMAACMEQMKAAGLCKDMDPAKCAEMKAKGLCCAKAGVIKADAGATDEATVTNAAVTKPVDAQHKGKQCDIITGKCGTKTTETKDDK